MVLRLFLIFSICCTLVIQHTAQSQWRSSSDVIPGQYIVQLSDHDALDHFKDFVSTVSPDTVIIRSIMQQPFELYLVDFGPTLQYDYTTILQRYHGIQTIMPNRRLANRSVPDDPLLINQWQYNNTGANGGLVGADLDMYNAWDITTGGVNHTGDTIVICVIDDGVNGLHEDIKSNMWVNRHEIPDNGIDDDNNGYVDDYLGWNTKYNNDSLYHGGSHGTSVAGIVGASGNNGKGVSGVNWNVKIMPVNYGDATEADAIISYAYAYTMRKLYNDTHGQRGAFVVATNSSWGLDNVFAEEAPIWCSLFDALGAIGIINIAATTNKNTDVDTEGDLPTTCTSPYLISVTNINNVDLKVTGAGYGRKSIDLGAYGQQVYTLSRLGYANFGGTSGATPHVTGVVGLLYAVQCPIFDSIVVYDPAGAARIARDMILYGTVSLSGLKDITTTGGKLNAFRALTNMQAICTEEILPAGIAIFPNDKGLQVKWVVGTESSIRLRYRQSDDLTWIVIENFKNGDTIPNLSFCTEYEIQLSSQAGLLPGAFGYSTFISTYGCCSVPKISDIVRDDDKIAFTILSPDSALYLIRYFDAITSDTAYVLLDDNKFELDEIPGCRAYSFSVQAQCLTYYNQSTFTESQLISTNCSSCTELDYCTDLRNTAKQEWIAAFTIGGQTISSGNSVTGYNNFAGLNVFDLKRDKSHQFHVRAGYTSSSYAEHFKIFIDFNQDGIWSSDELVYQTITPFRNELTEQFFIPESAKTGYTRMRIILSYENFNNACEKNNFEFGEVEDYCVWITSNCDANVETIVEVGKDSAVVHFFFPDDMPPSMSLFWKEADSEDWSDIVITDATTVLYGLEHCTKYQYYLQYTCDDETFDSKISTFKSDCSVNTQDFISGIHIFPNPADDILYIDIASYHPEAFTFQMTNLQGNSIPLSITQNKENILQANISHLAPGMYFITISNPQATIRHTLKFVKK